MFRETICSIDAHRGDTGELLAALEGRHRGRSIVTRDGQIVYEELDPSTEIYVLIGGTVRLFVGEGTSSRTTLLLRAPAIFGDRDTLAGCNLLQESAASIARAVLLCFPADEVTAAFSGDQEAREILTRDLLLRAARATRFSSFQTEPLEQRVLWLLFERQHEGSNELPPHAFLGAATDTSPKSVGRAIRDLEASRMIRLDSTQFRLSEEVLGELAAAERISLIHRLTPRFTVRSSF